MTPFHYIEFWDVPRCIALEYRGKTIVLESWFDEELDEYPNEYSVSLLENPAELPPPGSSWDSVLKSERILLGKIPISGVRFDESRRKELDAAFLDLFLE